MSQKTRKSHRGLACSGYSGTFRVPSVSRLLPDVERPPVSKPLLEWIRWARVSQGPL